MVPPHHLGTCKTIAEFTKCLVHKYNQFIIEEFFSEGFNIAPGNNWVLEVGREYEITVHIII